MRLFSFQREHWASYKFVLPTPLIGPLCNKKKVQNMPDNSLHIGPDQKAIPSLHRPSENCHVDILTKIDGWNNPLMDLRTSLILLWHNDINDEHLLIFPSPGSGQAGGVVRFPRREEQKQESDCLALSDSHPGTGSPPSCWRRKKLYQFHIGRTDDTLLVLSSCKDRPHMKDGRCLWYTHLSSNHKISQFT